MSAVTLEIEDNIAVIRISNPPVNALSHEVRKGIFDAVEQVELEDRVSAAVLICDGRTFIAGADIKEFGKPVVEPHLPDVISKIERSTKPWIAAIHGTALGGGMEVTLGCHYRIAVASAKLGLPEVNLGLIPGAGGTVRLPRLIPADAAVQLISSGRPVSSTKALELGILDSIIPSDNLRDGTLAFGESVLTKSIPTPISDRAPISNPDDTQWQQLMAPIEKKARGQESPLEAVCAVRFACENSAQAAYQNERERFVRLRDSEQSKALRYVFFAERQTTKIDRLRNVSPLSISQCGVLGGGTMGAGIAAAILLSGGEVVLVERDEASLDAGMARIGAILNASLARKLISSEKYEAINSSLTGSTLHSAFCDCDLVIEAVFEDMDVKRSVFASLDKETKPSAILATNTSYLDVNEIAKCVENPARIVGLHFFSPAHIMKLVEVIATDVVSDETLATAFAFSKSLRKIPVLSGVCEGFIANRIMSLYRRECEYMLEDGCLPFQIDKAMKDFGLPMGIFEMADMAGLDIGWATRKRLAATRDPDERYVHIADRICELGRFGQKTGAGWYTYEEGSRKPTLDPLVHQIVEEESTKKNIRRRDFSNEQIMDRILTAMTSEANALVDEGIAQRASDIDITMILGYGFPRWRGGPMFMAAS